MDDRIKELISDIPHWLNSYDEASKFSGPSLYFHLRTINCLRECKSPEKALNTEEFFDWLYATLVSWGMHRMGKGFTKLRELSEIKSSVRSQESEIKKLGKLRLIYINEEELNLLMEDIWKIIDNLTISISDAKIVANTKVLHHILPELIPPIDRTYTYNFFYNRDMLSIPEKDAFMEMYTRMHKIAANNRDLLQSRVGSGWYSSQSKILDNAIVGYVVGKLSIIEN
jgi:hypothetical protein